MIFSEKSYWLENAHVPNCLIDNNDSDEQTREGLSLVNLKISQGKIEEVIATKKSKQDQLPRLDLKRQIIFPCFLDIHTHLDKGHICERSPNLEGTFDMALTTARADGQKYWQSEDIYRRLEFGLKCSYAHGTQAIRTHIDATGDQADISLEVFQSLRSAWEDKITLQAASLVSLDYYQTSAGIALADKIAGIGGILGGVAWQNPDLDTQLDNLFTLAKDRNLDLDLHADENGDPDSQCLLAIAQAAIGHNFEGQIICGHCCSLAVQPAPVLNQTLELIKQANIAIVSLPMCNLYLQDRQVGTTPFWRGVTKVKELQQHDIPVAFASDNCRDPFYGFGDHDVLEVFEQAVRIAHLDTPYGNWISSITSIPANLMGLTGMGRIVSGADANLIIFPARHFSELLSRSQHERIILRQGKQINPQLPDYSELDDLIY
ncbi:cytosine deaminase [Chondrocystis sp. NIES-4102]|nr:cytosine deaminase [Chondrocystis sp. NIES-4102]